MNKKGQPEYIAEWLISMALVVVTIIIISLNAHNQEMIGNEITGITVEETGVMDLINYLKMPVEVDGEEMILSDLLVLWSIDKGYEDIIRTETKKVFDELYGENNYHIMFISGDEGYLHINGGDFNNRVDMVIPVPTQTMPVQNKHIGVVLEYGMRRIDLKAL